MHTQAIKRNEQILNMCYSFVTNLCLARFNNKVNG